MSLIVEDGSGVLKANSYVGLAYAYRYLQQRNRLTDWTTASTSDQEAALISATDYIDKRFGLKFLGDIAFTNLAVSASNFMMIIGLPDEDDTITFNETTYTFKVSATGPTEIEIGGSPEVMATNIVAAASTQSDMIFYAAGVMVGIEAVDPGPVDYETSSTSANLVFDTPTVTGGSLLGHQPLAFPRTAFLGIPEILKMATVEYATRALTEPLMPDPVIDESGQQVRRRYEKVGPVEEEIVFQNSPGEIFKTYPDADRLIKPLISDVGGVYR